MANRVSIQQILNNLQPLPSLMPPRVLLEQQRMAARILEQLADEGIPTGIALAALVNALAESQLDPLALSGVQNWVRPRPDPRRYDPTKIAVGLFQLHGSPVAAGKGLSIRDRFDPRVQTRRIADVLHRRFLVPNTDPTRLWKAQEEGADIRTLSRLFSLDIERPGGGAQEADRRAEIAESLFPVMSYTRANQLPDIRDAPLYEPIQSSLSWVTEQGKNLLGQFFGPQEPTGQVVGPREAALQDGTGKVVPLGTVPAGRYTLLWLGRPLGPIEVQPHQTYELKRSKAGLQIYNNPRGVS